MTIELYGKVFKFKNGSDAAFVVSELKHKLELHTAALKLAISEIEDATASYEDGYNPLVLKEIRVILEGRKK